jgi:uncharacterized protein (DUF1499 family)
VRNQIVRARYYLHPRGAPSRVALLLLLSGCAVPAPKAPSTETEFRALLSRGSGSNFVVTSDTAADSRLRTPTLPGSATDLRGRVLTALLTLPRWQIQDTSGAVIWATRATRLFRFTDDIYLLIESRPTGSAILARSASRVGKGDLGQNRRNLAEIWAALARLPEAASVTEGAPPLYSGAH